MARKTIFVSDLSGKEIESEREAVTITVKYGDARKGVIVVDAHPDGKFPLDREDCCLPGFTNLRAHRIETILLRGAPAKCRVESNRPWPTLSI